MIDGIKACVFDAYGTLFDVGSAVARGRPILGDKAAALAALWRDKQLQYSWLRSLQRRHADFWQVTGDALDFALQSLGLADADLRAKLMEFYRTLDPYPEIAGVLARLKASGIKTAILSNGTPDMLADAVAHAGIGPLLDWVLSVEEVGIYKTAPEVYQLALDRLGLAARQISFQSSNGWDVYAASAFGMRTVWCNRSGQCAERLPGAPDHVIRSLDELPPLLGLPL
jgi:2-haloacid dehalogenase